jgi:hypothetical protein
VALGFFVNSFIPDFVWPEDSTSIVESSDRDGIHCGKQPLSSAESELYRICRDNVGIVEDI